LDVGVDALILKARRSIVDNFNAGLVWLLKQDIFWFQVAMYDVIVALEFKGLKDLNREAPYKSDRNANKVV